MGGQWRFSEEMLELWVVDRVTAESLMRENGQELKREKKGVPRRKGNHD
jgi:hypothetical protein